MSFLNSPPDPGKRWGCAAAGFVGVPLFAFLLLVDALGDCSPNVPCNKGFLLYVLIPSVLSATGVGLTVRWLVNGGWRDRHK